jgi:EmrB/QacA subfamily drug resistance transporter
MFMIGVGGFAAASAVGGAAGSFEILLGARVAQGAFAALLAPAALSLLSITFSDDDADRSKAFGMFGAISAAGGATGLLLGGLLTETASWRWCLYVNVVCAVVAFVGACIVLRDGARTPAQRVDVTGAVLAVSGLAALVIGMGNAAEHDWGSGDTLVPTVTGVVLLAAFVTVERRAAHPLLPLRVVADRVRGTAYFGLAIAGTGSFAIFLFLTFYLQQDLGFSPILTGVAFLPMIGCVIIGAAGVSTALMPRTGPRVVLPVGGMLAAVGLALLTRTGPHTSYAATVLPSLIVMGVGLGMIFGAAQNVATSGVDDDDAGVASAMVNTAQQVGGSIGTAVFSSLAALAAASGDRGSALATVDGYHQAYWVASAVFAAGALVSVAFLRSGPIAGNRPVS